MGKFRSDLGFITELQFKHQNLIALVIHMHTYTHAHAHTHTHAHTHRAITIAIKNNRVITPN